MSQGCNVLVIFRFPELCRCFGMRGLEGRRKGGRKQTYLVNERLRRLICDSVFF